MKKSAASPEAEAAHAWFLESVTFEDEPYIMDLEQAEAVVDDSDNALVIARAGSGKTRTLVAKIIYLVAKRGIAPEDIMAFVFNANAAAEINERLSGMLVDGHPVIDKQKIAMTFHAFSRRIVYDVAGGREHCGDILAGEKDDFILALVHEMLQNPDWEAKIRLFIRGKEAPAGEPKELKDSDLKKLAEILDHEDAKNRKNAQNRKKCKNGKNTEKSAAKAQKTVKNGQKSRFFTQSLPKIGKNHAKSPNQRDIADVPLVLLGDPDDPDLKKPLTPKELRHFASSMSQFVNRAQQQFLGSGTTLPAALDRYRAAHQLSDRERLFLELGAECHRRYHWRLLDPDAALPAFRAFHTDFNLIVSWASQIIKSHRPETDALLRNKKYLLIDEYQDFSALFFAAVQAIRAAAPEAKLFTVGDDWQAINRFAGSDVDFFKHFERYFPTGSRLLNISTNYRCHYQIVDTARKFMAKSMQEKGNFSAFSQKPGEIFLVDPTQTPLGFALVDYDDRIFARDKTYQKFTASLLKDPPKKATVQYLKTLVEIIVENPSAKEILFLHRNNETNLQNIHLDTLQKSFPRLLRMLGLKNSQNPQQSIRFMTMHKSKGLESDVVVLLEADQGVIPRVHPDTYLYRFFGETEDVVLDDQKRLFYVALTRAKKRLYIVHKPAAKRSEDGFIQFLGHGLQKWHDD